MTKRLYFLAFLSFLLITINGVRASFHSPSSSEPALKSSRVICVDNVRRAESHLYSVGDGNDPFLNVRPLLGNIYQSSFNNLKNTAVNLAPNAAANADVVDLHSTVLEKGGADFNLAASADAFEKLDVGTTIKLSDSRPTMDLNAESMSETLKTNAQALQSFFPARPPAEDILEARDEFREWGNSYFSSVASTYKLPELFDSIVGGNYISESVDSVLKVAQDSIVAMDFEKNTPIYLLLLTFFWASDQRRVGLERGKKMAEAKISSLKAQLKEQEVAANLAEVEDLRRLVDAANEEKLANAAGIQDLKKKMENLQSQVEALTAAAAAQEKKEEVVVEDKVTPKLTKSIEVSQETNEETAMLEGGNEANAAKTTLDDEIILPDLPQSIEVEQEADNEAEGVEVELEVKVTKTSKVKGEKAATNAVPAKKRKKVVKKVKTAAKKKKTASTAQAKSSTKAKTKGKAKIASTMKTKTEEGIQEKEQSKQGKVAGARSDWGRLSQSTLRRKTVKELTSYLNEKGVEFTDDNGKTLKKNLLVDLILS